MQVRDWRERSGRLLADTLGPAAQVYVHSVAAALGSDPIGLHQYCQFLNALHDALPENLGRDGLDRTQLCDALCEKVLGTRLDWASARRNPVGS